MSTERIGHEIRSEHPYAYRTGQWARILSIVTISDRECYSLRWPDGATDEWAVDDRVAAYEFRLICAMTNCDANPGELYLCPQCIQDLDAWLEKGRTIVPEMGVTIARLDNVRPTNNEGNNGTKSAGSAAPLNIGALELQMSLEDDLRFTAADYAADPWSATKAPDVIERIKEAELLVSGPEDEYIDHAANRAKVNDIAPPMPMRELLPWLRTNAKMTITSKAIESWVHRGFLTPATRGSRAAPGIPAVSSTYHPHEVIRAWHERNSR